MNELGNNILALNLCVYVYNSERCLMRGQHHVRFKCGQKCGARLRWPTSTV